MGRPEQLVAEINAMGSKMQEFACASERAAMRYEAHMTLYRVAASTLDKEEMSRQRDALHTLLDVILDSGMHVVQCQNEMASMIKALALE